MVKLCGDSICVSLQVTYNNIHRREVFFIQWKPANVTAVVNKDNKERIKTFWPISLQPIFAQIIEKIIFETYNYLEKLSGFVPSTLLLIS